MLSWHGNAFCITGPLWGESSSHIRRFPTYKARNVQFWYLIVSLNKQLNKKLSCWWLTGYYPCVSCVITCKVWPYYNTIIFAKHHYSDVIMSVMASQITSLTIVYSTVYSGADQRKHQSSTSLAFVRGIHWWLVKSPHKWPVTQKIFPFDAVIMDAVNTPYLCNKGEIWGVCGEFKVWSVFLSHCTAICNIMYWTVFTVPQQDTEMFATMCAKWSWDHSNNTVLSSQWEYLYLERQSLYWDRA